MSEKSFLKNYNIRDYEPVSLTVDMTLFTIKSGELSVLLVERGGHPFQGQWALPGGFVEPNETPDESIERELQEETAITLATYAEQLKTYAGPNRDPRGYIVSVAYVALAPIIESPVAGDDARKAVFIPVEEALKMDLAFDHNIILQDGLERVRAKIEYAPLAPLFLEEDSFTLGELRTVYEIIWGKRLTPSNFRRKVLSVENLLEATGEVLQSRIRGGRRSELYKLGTAVEIYPPFRRNDEN